MRTFPGVDRAGRRNPEMLYRVSKWVDRLKRKGPDVLQLVREGVGASAVGDDGIREAWRDTEAAENEEQRVVMLLKRITNLSKSPISA